MSSNKFGKDELIEIFKEMKLTRKKYDEGIKIYEEKYEKNIPKKEKTIKSNKEKDVNIHKQPLRPYFLFQRDIMNEYKDKGKKIQRSEIGKMWKELDNNNRLKYADRYNNELKMYNEKYNIQPKIEI